MRRIEWMSSLRGKARHPVLDEWPRVVRARACLWMELHRARAIARHRQPLDRAVVERDVRHLGRVTRIDAEAVVLRCDEHPPSRSLEHGMVRAAVPERK